MPHPSALPSAWEIPREFRDRIGVQAGRQRAMLAEGHLLLVLHAPPKPHENQRRGRYFWRDTTGVWTSNELGAGIQALEKHLNEYANLIDKFESSEDAALTAGEYFPVLDGLAPIHRAVRNMHQTLQEARKMLPKERELIVVRDRSYEVERMADLLYGSAKNGLDLAIAHRAEQQAKSSQRMAVAAHRLNLLAAFFFPIATLTAIFGVTLPHGLENVSPPIPFFGLVGVGFLLGLILTAYISSAGAGGDTGKENYK